MAAKKRKIKNKNEDADQKTFVITIVLSVIACIALVIVAFVTGPLIGGKDAVDGTGSNDVSGSGASTGAGSYNGGNIGDTVTDITASTDAGAPPGTTSGMSVTVKTERNTAAGAEIVMIYPTVEQSVSSYSADEQNDAIREYMDEHRRIMCMGLSGEEYEYVIEKTELKYVGETFFSALVTGHFYLSDSPHPTLFAYAVNFDAASCSVLSGESLISDFSRVRDSFTSGKFSLKYGMDGLTGEISYEDMIMGYMTDYGIYPEVYYTGDNFGLAIELVYSLGGYALFEIPRSSLVDAVYIPAN